jgi:hypothetical protein
MCNYVIILNVIMLNVVMQIVVMLIVVMLSVLAPWEAFNFPYLKFTELAKNTFEGQTL